VVTALGSSKVEDSDDLIAAIAAHQPGDRVRATVRRGSETHEVGITLETQPDSVTSP
jgi:S1-C subfamily serine protease